MKGSSPRVWGQDTENYHVTRLDGIIPTRMGTSRQVTFSIVDFGDHPHAYGDKTSGYFPSVTGRGSSPRVWGQVFSKNRQKRGERIIPTRMGTSACRVRFHAYGWDHPHAYGDKVGHLGDDYSYIGSSPRVWGQARCNAVSQVAA